MNVNLRRKLDIMRCELCGKPHEGEETSEGLVCGGITEVASY